MCFGCEKVWTALQVLWSSLYVISGAAQLIAGIFFLISIPAVHLSCNIWTGSWNILVGIAGGTLACLGQMCSRRQEFLLYMAVSILIVNSVNIVLSECGLYFTDMPKLLKTHPYQTLINYACFATRIATAIAIIVSFLDSQFSFCTMQAAPKTTNSSMITTTTATTLITNRKKKLHDSHEQVSDIEYIIPRPKPATKPQTTVLNAYSQSWVFESDPSGSTNNLENSYIKILENGTTTTTTPPPKTTQNLQNGNVKDCGGTHVIDNPVVHIEDASDDSNSNSDRKLCHMRSFSRSTSPIILSASSSHLSLTTNQQQQQLPIYECLEKLTEPTIYRSRLNTALSNKSDDDIQYQIPQSVKRIDTSLSPQTEKVQYASLMKELQRAIVNKKEQNQSQISSSSGSNTQTNSKSSSIQESSSHSDCGNNNKNNNKSNSSDTEFSKELEAALQLIQDLESPNTIETPSELKELPQQQPLSIWRNSDDGSDKTLSATIDELTTSPLTECQPPPPPPPPPPPSTCEMQTFKPPINMTTNGKNCASVVVHYPDSQSTSGYSSPTHITTPTNWSTTSSLNGTTSSNSSNNSNNNNNDIVRPPMSYSIHCAKSTTVISLYPKSDPKLLKTGKSITLVNITTNDNNNSEDKPSLIQNNSNNNNNNEGLNQKPEPIIWNVKSLLRRKKSTLPKLCPELEGAIIKSETLAYLTENELLARHQRNKEIQRKIEERVIQQLGTPRTESIC